MLRYDPRLEQWYWQCWSAGTTCLLCLQVPQELSSLSFAVEKKSHPNRPLTWVQGSAKELVGLQPVFRSRCGSTTPEDVTMFAAACTHVWSLHEQEVHGGHLLLMAVLVTQKPWVTLLLGAWFPKWTALGADQSRDLLHLQGSCSPKKCSVLRTMPPTRFLFMHEMELGCKPRIFTSLNIRQDFGRSGKMLSDGCVCECVLEGCVTCSSCPAFWPLSSKY